MFEIKGKLHKYSEQKRESKTGKEYIERLVLIETDDKYSPIMAFDCTEKAGEFLKTQRVGVVGNFIFNYKSNEYNGKWFRGGSIYRVDISATETHEANQRPAPAANNGGYGGNVSGNDSDGLPF